MTRTRFAPSPTGFLHIGGLRTAAYAFAIAKHDQGQFLLRIEDTDQKREVEGATEKIFDILKKFRLNWDEGPIVGGPHGPYIQSERVESGRYREAAEKLLAEGHAFYCFCQPKTKEEIKEEWEEKKIELRDPCRRLSPEEVAEKINNGIKPAIRLKVPDGEKVSFHDLIVKKETVWNTDDVDDAMLLKSDGFPTYHLAVAVDDTDMQITHVIRAMEWFSSTPIHILVYKYLGLAMPQIGHPTAILDPEGGKLSKRKGNVSCEDFLERGYLPEALLNFVILLGWAPKDNREMYTLEEFVEAFDMNGFQKSNPTLNLEKLNWFNGQYIRKKSDSEVVQLAAPFFPPGTDMDRIAQVVPLLKDRAVTLMDFMTLSTFFFATPTIDPALWKNPTDSSLHLRLAAEIIPTLSWTKDGLDSGLVSAVDAKGWKRGDFFMSLRIAICGSRFTPPLTDTMMILGRDEVLARIKKAGDTV